MRIDVLTLFPGVLEPFLKASIIGRAQASSICQIVLTDIREHTTDPHRRVDDRPYGGGPGMVMMCDPVFRAVHHAQSLADGNARLLMMTPQGRPLKQDHVQELAAEDRLMLLCGHYEGFDERIRVGLKCEELSIGDYVLSGGEAAAMVVIDAIVRLLPNALGDESSANEDSFSDGMLEYPHYTRPRTYENMTVPDVLLSGDHKKIREWRQTQSRSRTIARRPDLLSEASEQPSGVQP